jgi:prepilin-type N-terminal cleavage/methylation domain-containing protein/prepilin-type processing-associated H-X9-DG protein
MITDRGGVVEEIVNLPHSATRRENGGFTLIELMIVVFVVGLLVSLLLPAVQDARESARRASCQNNLRQIGMALQSFESREGRYPNAFCGVVDLPEAHYTRWCVSPSAQIIAFLDDGSRAAEIGSTRTANRWDPAKLTLDAPAVLRCPSDSLATGEAASYRFCRGVWPIYPGDPGGVFTAFKARHAADVTDGLSNTAFASERLIGTRSALDPVRDPLLLPDPASADLAIGCVAANQGSGAVLPPVPGVSPMGSSWMSGSWIHCVYYHLFPPNSRWRDCMPDSGLLALATPRSHHRTGVNVLFGDGRVQFVMDEVHLPAWRAFATRAGGEAL